MWIWQEFERAGRLKIASIFFAHCFFIGLMGLNTETLCNWCKIPLYLNDFVIFVPFLYEFDGIKITYFNKKYAAYKKERWSDDQKMIKYVLFKYILGGKQASREIWQCGFKYFFTLFITYTEWVSNGTLPGYDKLMFWVRILLVLSFSNYISITLFECIICVWVFFSKYFIGILSYGIPVSN